MVPVPVLRGLWFHANDVEAVGELETVHSEKAADCL